MAKDDLTAAARRAIAQAGGVTKLAAHLGIHKASVSGWRQVPAERLPAVAALTGIPAEQLRPDIYGSHPAPVSFPRPHYGEGEAQERAK